MDIQPIPNDKKPIPNHQPPIPNHQPPIHNDAKPNQAHDQAFQQSGTNHMSGMDFFELASMLIGQDRYNQVRFRACVAQTFKRPSCANRLDDSAETRKCARG